MARAHANGNLSAYEHYWYVAQGYGKDRARQRMREIRDRAQLAGTWGRAGDPLGAQTPAAQNKMLSHLQSMAVDGRIDDWETLVDPTLSYEENKAILLENGAKKPRTQQEQERKDLWADLDDRQKRHAREQLREHFDAIEAGEKQQLVDDIAEAFGEQFVAGILEAERIERSTPVEGAPEPRPDPTPEPTGATIEIEESRQPTPTPEPTTHEITVEASSADRPNLAKEAVDLVLYLSGDGSVVTADDRPTKQRRGIIDQLRTGAEFLAYLVSGDVPESTDQQQLTQYA